MEDQTEWDSGSLRERKDFQEAFSVVTFAIVNFNEICSQRRIGLYRPIEPLTEKDFEEFKDSIEHYLRESRI